VDADQYEFHHRSQVDVATSAENLFAQLDDHRRLAGHMERPSLMMAGATMQIETDALQGQAVGWVIRVTGRVLGIALAVEEVVTERVAPRRKTWETRGEPRLLVIGAYRMGFPIVPRQNGWQLAVFIDYRLPKGRLAHLLGLLFGGTYAAWCARQMTTDAALASSGVLP